jgi:RHS repeat-associated protein
VETYSATGLLSSITSRSGRVVTFTYSDGSASGPTGSVYEGGSAPIPYGHLLRVTDDTGRSLEFRYGTHGSIARVIDPAGESYRYSYDSAGNLTGVEYPNGRTRTYHYNESANTSGANIPHSLTGITDENGSRYATYKYLSDRRPLSTEHAGGVDKYQLTYGTGSTTYVDPLGASRTATYTTILGVKQVTSTSRSCTGCGPTATESYTFDANRNATSRKDFNGNLTCYSYDARNLETARTEGLSGSSTCAARVTTPATRTITTEWHSSWRLRKRVAEPLRITTYAYHGEAGVSCAPAGASTTLPCAKTVQATADADGSLGLSGAADGAPRTWSYTYNAQGRLLTVDGPRADVSDVTAYAYYAADDPGGNFRAGDLASVTNALGQVTQYVQYDGAGRVRKSIDPNGLETLLEYWPRGWLKSRQVGTASAGYETTSYDYDYLGNLAKVTAPDASFVTYTYDGAHRLTQVADGLGNRIEYTLDNMGNRTAENAFDPGNVLARSHSRVIDGLNRVFKEIGGTNPATQVTQNGFDANGNLTSILDPLGRTTTQEHDALNRLTAVKDPFNGPAAPTTYAYNRQGHLTQVTDPTGLATSYTVNGHGETLVQVSPDTGTTSFTHDAASNMVTRLDARGVQASYAYDALNRVTQIGYPDETVTYTYDACANGIGRLCAVSDRTGSTTYAYDIRGRVTAKTQLTGALSRAMGYAYNAAGQLAIVTTASGRQVSYGYANNRPVSVTVDGVPVLGSADYEPFGPIAGWLWGNHSPGAPNAHTRLVDRDFRVTRVRSDLPVSGSQALFDRQFGWDDQGRVMSIADLANAALSASYGYDALDRLASAAQGASSWGYTYNGIGDRLTSTAGGAATTYGYGAGTHRLSSLSGAQARTYTFDAAGNMTSDGTLTWVYGGHNRPTAIGTLAIHVNALGQRVKKQGPTSATVFVYDEAGRLWGEYSDTGALIQETVWLDDLPVATLRPGATGVDIFYVHPDHLGTPRAVSRPADNQLVWRWDNTEPFGNAPADENPGGVGVFVYNLRFPGQYFDQETGMHYNYFRDYDPTIGRYVESDPLGMLGGPNTFHYVSSNPLRRTDFFGLKDCGTNDIWGKYVIPDNPFGFAFQPCCQGHDRCYDDPCNVGSVKGECDGRFYRCMTDKCKTLTGAVRWLCDLSAATYYTAVDQGAAAAYLNARGQR